MRKFFSSFFPILIFLFSTTFVLHASECFIVFLVDAKGLDYSRLDRLLMSMVKNPSRSVGHAWVYLQGTVNGQKVVVEGGHSGEMGISEPRYRDRLQKLIAAGDSDPVKALWMPLHDGFLQKGSGGHRPTAAALIPLSEERFKELLDFIHPCSFDYSFYSLTERQCVTFAQLLLEKVTSKQIDCQQTVPVPSYLRIGWKKFHLWSNPSFSHIDIATPENLQKQLQNLIHDGIARDALTWYRHEASNKMNKIATR